MEPKKLTKNQASKETLEFPFGVDKNTLRDLVAKLPPAQREVIIRRYWWADTIEEIAEALGLRFDDVMTIIKCALANLRAEVERSLTGPTAPGRAG